MPALVPQDFLDLVGRLLPGHFLQPLQDEFGYELLQAFAAQMARVSTAVDRLEQGVFVVSAPSGARAAAVVRFRRDVAVAGAVTVKAGTLARARGTRDFVLVGDVVFGAAALGPLAATAAAVAQGYEYNVLGQVVTAAGVVLPGDVDTIFVLLEEPASGDLSMRVDNLVAASGGAENLLGTLGEERGLARFPGESAETYRERLARLPDTVSPDALGRAIDRVMATFNGAARLVEAQDQVWQTCWDYPSAPAFVPPAPDASNTFVYDDPRPAWPFRNRWLSEEAYRGAFVVVADNVGHGTDVGMYYDDTAMDIGAHVSPSSGGRRAHAAYDVPPTGLPANFVQGGYDGFDLPRQALYGGLYALLGRIKAGGVGHYVDLRGT